MKRIETKVLFRPSTMGQVMTDPQGKSNRQKYVDALDVLAKLNEKCEVLQGKLKLNEGEINFLEHEKDNETPARKNAKSPAEKYRLAIATKSKTQQDLFELYGKIELQEAKISELEAVKDTPNLSATCKKLLKTMAIEMRYNRKKRLENKYTKKGTIQENESIDLYGDYKGEVFENNKKRAENDHFTGEWDIDVRNSKNEISEVVDIKTRFDIDTFFDNLDEEMQSKDEKQLLAYCDLLGCERATIANVLTNTHFEGIMDEIRRETFNMKADDLAGFEVPMFRVLEIVKDNIFDEESYFDFIAKHYSPTHLTMLSAGKLSEGMGIDQPAVEMFNSFVEVPLMERVIEVSIDADQDKIEAMKARISECRIYLAEKFNIHHVNG